MAAFGLHVVREEPMRITYKHRSMIASTFVAAFDHATGTNENKRRSICCSSDALEACVSIVGKTNAKRLRAFFYSELGCCGWEDKCYQDVQEQYFLDKIANLEYL